MFQIRGTKGGLIAQEMALDGHYLFNKILNLFNTACTQD